MVKLVLFASIYESPTLVNLREPTTVKTIPIGKKPIKT
jgi:hypothetical protein